MPKSSGMLRPTRAAGPSKNKAKQLTEELLGDIEKPKKKKRKASDNHKSVLVKKKSIPDFGDEELNSLIHNKKPNKRKK